LRSERVQDALPDDLGGKLALAIRDRKWVRVPTSSQSLLGGIATCAICGGRLRTSSTRAGRKGRVFFQYRCDESGHVGISGPWLDRYVTDRIVATVDTGKLVEAIRKRKATGQTRKASEIEARLELLDEMFGEGKLTPARYERMNAQLVGKLGQARREERDRGMALPEELARNLGERWDDLSVTGRRRIISAVTDSIVISKAEQRGPIDDKRVTFKMHV